MQNELKPCPFCGGEAILNKYGYRYINCPDCFAMTGSTGDVDRLVNNWNTRQPVDNWKPIEELTEKDIRQFGGCFLYDGFEIDLCEIDEEVPLMLVINKHGPYFKMEELKDAFTHYSPLTPPKTNHPILS